MMKALIDDSLRSKLNGLDKQAELCEESGRTVGHFLPDALYKKLLYAFEQWPYAEEEMSRADAPSECSDEAIELFRPVGQKELDLIRDADFRRFPPRLPSQPIFYPVLNEEYAVQIAREWNAKDQASGFVGYVTRFRVRKVFLDRYEVHTVGRRIHQEYWIPSEDLDEFNRNIVGPIEVAAEFRGGG